MKLPLRLAISAALSLPAFLSVSSAVAEGVISQPGNHNEYAFEIEPQLAIRTHTPCCYGNAYGYGRDYYYGWSGFGPGVRVSIPFMHNGPVKEINNNIAISFGGALTFHSNRNTAYNVTVINLPVAFQWNFYFTEIVSAFGEAGLNTPITFGGGYSHFTVEPLVGVGGRFQWDKVGVVVRLSYPLFSVGANFQF